jgi:voltage-gated potassium channel
MTMAWDALARDGGYVLLRWRLPDDEWADADLVVGCTSTSVNLLGGGEPCDVVPTKAVATEGPAVAYLASRPPAREAPGTARQWPPPHAGCFPWALPNSRENIALEVVSQLVTLVSIAILCAESTLAERDTSDVPERGRYFLAEALCIGWFTVELTFRFSFSSAKSRFFYQPLNLVDLASITPFFVLLIARETASNGFAAIRAIRVMRILKLADGSSSVEDLVLAITCTRNQLLQFMVLFFCQALLWASIVFYIEKDDGDPGFTSVPATLWWAYITFTSVGYGDIVPVTAWGRVVVSFAVLMGLLLLTLPTTIFTDTFTGFFDRRRNVQRKAESDNRIREIHKVEHYLLVAKDAIDSR